MRGGFNLSGCPKYGKSGFSLQYAAGLLTKKRLFEKVRFSDSIMAAKSKTKVDTGVFDFS